MLAVILISADPDRLYTAFSLLVSTAAEGEEALGLLSFEALPAINAGTLDTDLRAAAEEVGVKLYACSAAGDPGPFEVMSTPRFLKLTAGARLVVV